MPMGSPLIPGAESAGEVRRILWLWPVEWQVLAWLRKARATVSKRAKLSNLAADLADHERACACRISRKSVLWCRVPCLMLGYRVQRSSVRYGRCLRAG
jgi:hypothetical protein